MAERKIEYEVEEALKLISHNKNFLLSGGAGSGKTYSLVQIINQIILEHPNKRIACITYTNAAVREIRDRVSDPNLIVSTIHDFIWDNIKTFQRDLKKALIYLMKEGTIGNIDRENFQEDEYFESTNFLVEYGENARLRNGIISHDEVIKIASYMFENYKLLCDILKDKYPFILIDEYQDTDPLVIKILLEYLKQSQKTNIVGFFGDSMQSIYDTGIGDLNVYLENNDVCEIQKQQNRRNPQQVIQLANLIRVDGLQQVPSTDTNAPNMINGEIKKGNIKFIYSSLEQGDEYNLEKIKKTSYFHSWNFKDSIDTKELYLTHNLIAPKVGFPNLMMIYDKDPIIEFKQEVVKTLKDKKIDIAESWTYEEAIREANIVYGSRSQKYSGQAKIDVLIQNEKNKESYEELRHQLFSKVKRIYLDRDSLIDDKKENEDDISKSNSKRDYLIKHLFKIQSLIEFYKNSMDEFIRKTEFLIKNISDKKRLKEIVLELDNMSNSTIEEVINYADETGICYKDDKLNYFIEQNEYLYNKVKKVKYEEFQNLFLYLEGYTPYSTQHKIKGAEFKNVFVVLDNGKWNNFNFERLFTGATGNERVLSRTQKIFYVCCTRATDNLIVYYHKPNNEVIAKAKKWFGIDNVHLIEEV